ncbi:fibronectin type III domain-containing protein [Kribbella ginsengisoli]|uniref:Fibronectin type-III domain-containing protein n=1 Tax=Kribbella ginsengisoli TaxID=363865 RepID=A0ABP6W344_9ACTN
MTTAIFPRGRRIPALLISIALIVAGLVIAQPSARAATPVGQRTAAQLNAAFTDYGDTSGQWSGADATASVLLPDGRVAWLFSDTYIGPVNADKSRPANTPMINNSMVIQSGDSMQSIFRGTPAAPSALMPPNADGDFFWVGDGVVSGGKLLVAYNRFARSGQGALDMDLQGTSLATFNASTFALESAVALPVGDKVAWGVEMVQDGGYTYVYGSEYVSDTLMRFAHVARTNSDLSAPWQYWNGSAWVADEAASARILSGVGTTFGVQKTPTGWVLLTQQAHGIFRDDFVAYPATSPVGPFAEPVVIHKAPEPGQGNDQIVYDVHVHTDLTSPGRLLWSYNVNSLSATGNTTDAHIYRPRFVDTNWPVPVPDPSTVPAQVTGQAVTQTIAGEAELSWNAVPGATRYWVYQKNVTDGQTTFAREPDPVTETTADISFVKHAKTYQFAVTAANDNGEGPRSATASITMNIVPPVAPVGVTAVPDGTGAVRVSWEGVPQVWNYEVFYRSVDQPDSTFVSATTVGAGERSLVVKSLQIGEQHEFYVIARGAGGDSPHSTVITATPVGIPPAAPADLTAVPAADGTIALSWTASTTPGVWYWVYQRDVTAEETDFVRLSLPISSGTSMTAAYLADGHSYEFAVTAYNDGGESAKVAATAARSSYPKLAAPANLAATAGDGEVKLAWRSLGDDIWYWVYQRDVTDGETTFTKLPLPIAAGTGMTAGYLSNGHTYEFKVSGIGPNGEGALSAAVQATPKFPTPAPVTSLVAAAQTDGTIKVTWGDVPSTYFWVYQRDVTAGESFVKLEYPTDKGAFTAAYLKHGHVYEFKVQPNANGIDGPISGVVRATSHYNPPPAPTGLVARAMGDATIRLDWNGVANVSFWVYQRDVTAGQTTFTKLGLPSLDKTAELGLMKAGHKYEFKVAAENQGGLGALSAVASATSYGGLPVAPKNLTAVAQDGQVKLSWTGSTTSGVQYIVYQRNMTSGDAWERLPLPVTGTSMTAGLLQNGQTYAFRVSAQNGIGESGGTNIVESRPMPPFPTAPTSLTATPGNGFVNLSWSAGTPASILYWVEMRPAGGNWSRLPLPISARTLKVTFLRNAVTYEFRVRSNNLSGTSAPSPVDTARPMPPAPTAPASITASAADRKVTIDWSDGTPTGVYYWIEYRVAGKGWIRLPLPVAGQTKWTILPLANNTRYEFRVRSANEAGVSAPSPVAVATPIPPVPTAPIIFTPSEHEAGITVGWFDTTVDLEYYQVWQRNRLTGAVYLDGALKDPVASVYSEDIAAFEFKVRSSNSRGWGPWSATVTGVPKVRWYSYATGRSGNGAPNLAAKLATRGKTCKNSNEMVICFNIDLSAGQKRPLTLGDYLGYPGSESDFNFQIRCEALRTAGLADARGTAVAQAQGRRLLKHEYIHTTQWAKYGIGFGALYEAAGLAAWKQGLPNPFESQANLYWGGYVPDVPGLPGTNVC